jgi:hypothetical protein
MEELLGGERKQLVMLTATPINNVLWDLYNLVMLFAHHDRAFSSIGIPSIRELFVHSRANERDPENLDPDLLFPIADAVSVRRDRLFIQERYLLWDDDDVVGEQDQDAVSSRLCRECVTLVWPSL